MKVFRIFSNDDDPKVWYREKKIYEAHLKTIPKKHLVLWKYFAGDFFHDGHLKKMEFSDNQSTFSFRILCPNLMEFGKTKWKYRNAWYRCEFKNVVYFWIGTEKLNKANNPLGGHKYTEYLYSEVDTLKEKMKFYSENYGGNFHSLIVQLIPVERYMVLIFKDVNVSHESPTSFRKMLDTRNIHVPLYQEEMTASQEKIYTMAQKR